MWSLGVIMTCILRGKPLYGNVFEHLSRWNIQDIYNIPISNEAQDLLNKMLEPKCSKRISLEKCLEHEWFEI